MSSELSQRLARRRCLNGEAEIRMVSLVKEEKGTMEHENEDTSSERENTDNSNHGNVVSSKIREETIASLPYCQMCGTSISIQKCLSCETFFCYFCGNNHVPDGTRNSEDESAQRNNSFDGQVYYSPRRMSPAVSPKNQQSSFPVAQATPTPTAPTSSSSSTTEKIIPKNEKDYNNNSNGSDDRSPQTLSDDISETTSVYSDTHGLNAGVGMKGVSKNSVHIKKHTQIVQKLKLEIASLQEQLNESSYTDIQTIQTKLRTTMLEMQRIKDHNMELKDRVQSLEDRLYTTLQREILLNDELEKAKKTSTSKIKVEDDVDSDTGKNDVTSIKSLKAEISGVTHGGIGRGYHHRSAKDWQRRCLHLERLTNAYEERIKTLEVRCDVFVVVPLC